MALSVSFSLLVLLSFGNSATACDCNDKGLCGPLASQRNGTEFMGFLTSQSPTVYKKLDWTKVTTLIINSISGETKDFVCCAKARNVRVTFLTTISIPKLESNKTRELFVNQTVSLIVANNLDGVNIDFEGNIYVNTTPYYDLTLLMHNLRSTLLEVNKNFTLSMDYVECPECIVGRTYDYRKLMHIVDYFIIMDYDMQGQRLQRTGKTNYCQVLSNSPYAAVYRYAKEFLASGVPPSKLVLAFPWYGYKDKCLYFVEETQTCYANCITLDKGYLQVPYGGVMSELRSMSKEGRQWNVYSMTPTYTYVDQYGQRYQVNYDDPWSLRMKYDLVVQMKLRGSGTWTIGSLDYSNTVTAVADRELMWSVIPTGR